MSAQQFGSAIGLCGPKIGSAIGHVGPIVELVSPICSWATVAQIQLSNGGSDSLGNGGPDSDVCNAATTNTNKHIKHINQLSRTYAIMQLT